MNLNELKISGINNLNIKDALNAPLLKLKLWLNESSSSLSNLIIYVSKSENSTDLKTYEFPIILQYTKEISDEFIIEPVIKNNKVTMRSYILRKIDGNTILENEYEEEVGYQAITLFEGNNCIYSNYENATIEVIYPKNCDFVKHFLNHALLNEQEQNALTEEDLYFKNVFTQVEEGINIDANNLNVNCITSKNNKFSLDSDGNLVVNSITSAQNSNISIDFNSIYPLGSIYMSVNNINPSTLFGGVWEQIAKGRTLVGVDPSQTEFNVVEKIGGSKYTEKHNHDIYAKTSWDKEIPVLTTYAFPNENGNFITVPESSSARVPQTSGYALTKNFGEGNAGNLQPFITCYIWKRTA